MSIFRVAISGFLFLSLCCQAGLSAEPVNISGIYPHLAMFNDEAECGTGAVVPWANRLWVITYGPHLPFGSSDKLYEITPELKQLVRKESVGGTHANRHLHRESGILAIGPYLIDEAGQVRVIPWKEMPGRLTGTARHLTDPANKLYYATMEEGLYEVDVHTLEVKKFIRDENPPKFASDKALADQPWLDGLRSSLPGYHGKGLFSGQGRLVYSNNGEHGPAAQRDPTTPSGALAEWKGSGDWKLIRRNQFTEVTGPGGIYGNEKETDPIWSIGWDAKSLLLMLLDDGKWHTFRLPKASHSYDGAHGWNTEWPRIRDIGPPGKPDLLMTMHGTFWRFPITFSANNTAGIRPRSNYLKVVGDFCRWQDRIVLGCDDTAKSEFLNKRKLKGGIAGPGQSHSNLWFLKPEQLDELGPVIGRGAVWHQEPVKRDVPSDPFLVAGYDEWSLLLEHDLRAAVTFTLEVDKRGDNNWTKLETLAVEPKQIHRFVRPRDFTGEWLRVSAGTDVTKATTQFHLRNADKRKPVADEMFAGIATSQDRRVNGGIVYVRGSGLSTLRLAGQTFANGVTKDASCYDLDENLNLKKVDDKPGFAWAQEKFAIPKDVIQIDEASVLHIDEQGRRWRLPKGDPSIGGGNLLGPERTCREVCTERDLLNVQGTFYELPAENAGGFAKLRPICTHNRRIHDYCSYRGLLVISGLASDEVKNPHVITSDDGLCKLWVGAVDDLWKFGKPRGTGGPWHNSIAGKGEPSDPFSPGSRLHRNRLLPRVRRSPRPR
jgi:hypothetical protein